MEFDKFVFVKKRTMLEELLRRHSTTSQAKFYLESAGKSYSFYEESHKKDKESLRKVIEQADDFGKKVQILDKDTLETFIFGERDLIIAVGDDGLMINIAKYLKDQPVISVNPNPSVYDGVLSTCNTNEFNKTLSRVIKGNYECEKLTMAETNFDNGEVIYALNDFYIGKSNHSSSRYELSFSGRKERQSSDGIIVSTGTGSTGWLAAIASGFRAMGGKFPLTVPFPRDADYLTFVVRNPFVSRITGANLAHGKIHGTESLTIESAMPERGVIFSDGIDTDFIEFNSGRTATIKISDKKVYLVKKESDNYKNLISEIK